MTVQVVSLVPTFFARGAAACSMDRDVDAVLAASIFHYGEHTIGEAKSMMRAAGIRVR